MNDAPYSVFTTDNLIELLEVDNDTIRAEIFSYDVNNDSCAFYDYTIHCDEENRALKIKLNEKMKAFNLSIKVILINDSW